MKLGAKSKIISAVVTLSIISVNFALADPAKAAVSAMSLINFTNEARKANGLKPYQINKALSISAQAKAEDMLKGNYFAHYSPQGKSPWGFIKNAGYIYTFAGENLAIDFFESADAHNAWMASPTHRANILDKDFTEIGIAVASGEYQGRNATIVVQHFGARAAKVKNLAASPKKIKSNVKAEKSTPKIKLDLPKPSRLSSVSTPNPTPNFIWYSSPALYLIKIFV